MTHTMGTPIFSSWRDPFRGIIEPLMTKSGLSETIFSTFRLLIPPMLSMLSASGG